MNTLKAESFSCDVVGENVDIEDCRSRRKQAQELKDKGAEHYSLSKCLVCLKYNNMKKIMEDRLMKPDTQKMKRAYSLAVDELEKVLAGEKSITDVTKIAAGTVANYSRIKSTEIHEMGLKITMQKNDIKLIESSED